MNAAMCGACGDVIRSRHRHDFVTCCCGSLSVDGGEDYQRVLWMPDGPFSLLSDDDYWQEVHDVRR